MKLTSEARIIAVMRFQPPFAFASSVVFVPSLGARLIMGSRLRLVLVRGQIIIRCQHWTSSKE
jgi:hypothetical protein